MGQTGCSTVSASWSGIVTGSRMAVRRLDRLCSLCRCARGQHCIRSAWRWNCKVRTEMLLGSDSGQLAEHVTSCLKLASVLSIALHTFALLTLCLGSSSRAPVVLCAPVCHHFSVCLSLFVNGLRTFLVCMHYMF